MPAKFIKIGEPAHDAERQALNFLVEGLPANYTVYSNAWLVERSGVVYEIDAVVVAPHAVFVVEIKSYRGAIEGTDHDWYIPHPIPSPLKKNRICAQVLRGQLKRESYQAGQVWVQDFVFLSATTNVGVRGPASNDRLHTRKRILAALQDVALIERLSGRVSHASTEDADKALVGLLTGDKQGARPIRRIREYEILETLAHHDTFAELLGKNRLSDAQRVLRIYSIPPLATDEQRERITERARWEAQVLGRLGRSEGILKADPPFDDEAGIVLPLEQFKGITLTTWIEKYGPGPKRKNPASLTARTDLWLKIAGTLDDAHQQGVVHRLLRPEVILVEDSVEPAAIRVTGFDLAKQLAVDVTVSLTTLAEERMVFAAPEVVSAFSSAEPASDQFSLGAILALLLTGKSLFDSTRQYMAQRRLLMRVRDLDSRMSMSLDEAVSRMVALKVTDRYPSLKLAMAAVRTGRETKSQPNLPQVAMAPLDPDNLSDGARIGTDYDIIKRLNEGGMAVVYAARHLVSGRTRALKIAKADTNAEDALRSEYQALSGLDHPNIVRVIDLTAAVAGRLTMVMERVGGETMAQWLRSNEHRDFPTLRRIAEDLLAGLDYLEQRGVTHKDLKPDNLLVGDGRLTIIDFGLVGIPEDAVYSGTALYRDPATVRWSHATDRYAAALCLFELYAGRRAFDGLPEPGDRPSVTSDDIDPPGLAAFFQKALDPAPDRRFPSARAMRDTFVVALGDDQQPVGPTTSVDELDSTTPLQMTGLSRRAINALTRCQVGTIGELLLLSDTQVRAIHAIGSKTAADVIEFQRQLRERGLKPTSPSTARLEPPLVPDLADSPEPIERLPMAPGLLAALTDYALPTVGAVASLTQTQLLAVPGIGRKRLAEVVEALHQFRTHSTDDNGLHTLDRLWDLAARPLTERQRIAVERVVGLLDEPQMQADIARDLGLSQSKVSLDYSQGIERLDQGVLADLLNALEAFLGGFGGITRVDELGRRFEQEWPGGMVSGAGMVRLLVRLSSGRAHCVEVDGVEVPLVARAVFDRDTLRAFAGEVSRLAGQWPPVEQASARRTLSSLLPHYEGDPLSLGVRLCQDVQLTNAGHLFVAPVDAEHSIPFVLAQVREPITLVELAARVRETFGKDTPYPAPDQLMALLRALDCQVQGHMVIPGTTSSVVDAPTLPRQAPPASLERSAEAVVADILIEQTKSRGFRMLVAPPEIHVAVGRSVAQAIKGTWVSFDDEFFTEHAANMPELERAERFIAQRGKLTEAAEQTLLRLLEQHGRPGNVIVLGETALFALCDALDFPRRLYDETLSGTRGFWVVVVPGVIHNRQPRFNEGAPMWHLEGATTALLNPLPPPARG